MWDVLCEIQSDRILLETPIIKQFWLWATAKILDALWVCNTQHKTYAQVPFLVDTLGTSFPNLLFL